MAGRVRRGHKERVHVRAYLAGGTAHRTAPSIVAAYMQDGVAFDGEVVVLVACEATRDVVAD